MSELARCTAAPAGAGFVLFCNVMTGFAEDRHAGSYHPKAQSRVNWPPRSRVPPGADKGDGINFVSATTNKMIEANDPPPHAIHANRADAERLIIVAVGNSAFDSLNGARAFFSMVSAQARATPIFRRHGVETLFTSFHLADLMGLKQFTVSDGRSCARQVFLK